EDPTTEVIGYEAGIPGLWWRINVEASDFSLASPEYSYQTFGTLEAAQAAAQADYERRILSALEPAAPEGQQPVANEPATNHWPEAYEVADILAENKGFWRACSGCHETNEGHPTGPWS